MLRKLLLTASVAAAFCFIPTASVHAMGGTLSRPGIAIPSADGNGKLDPTAAAMNQVLGKHEKQFAGGHFINAHSVLHFSGGTKTINALLDELSQVDGAVLYIRFSKDGGSFASPFGDKKGHPTQCDCTIDHNAWANACAVTIRIYLGGDNVTLEDLSFPAIKGSAKPK
jgi:hypothetical protein